MDAIRDLTWVRHLRAGRAVERLVVGDYRVVSLKMGPSENNPADQYVYRMLFFPAAGHKPVLALNLESSILGSFCLTEQAGARHTRFGTVEDGMEYEVFRRWALSRAEEVLSVPVAAQGPG